jgi:hypothetical protein
MTIHWRQHDLPLPTSCKVTRLYPTHTQTTAGQLKGLEVSLQTRLDACCSQLQGLAAVLSEISRLEKEDSKNPFAGEVAT